MKFDYCVVGIAVRECQGCLLVYDVKSAVHSVSLPLYAQIYKGVFVRAIIWERKIPYTSQKLMKINENSLQ